MKKIIFFLGLATLIGCSSLPKYVESQSILDANDALMNAQLSEANGHNEQAQFLFKKSFDLYTGVDNLKGIIISGLAIARQYYHLDDMEQYDEWYMKMSVIANNNAPELLPLLYILQMEVAFDMEEYENVITLSYRIDTSQKEMQTELLSYRLLALLKTEQSYKKEFDGIKKNIATLRKMFKKNKLDNPKIVSYAAYTLGYALSKEKKWKKALGFFNIAYEYDQLIGNKGGLADDIFAIGIVYENLGDKEKALSCFIRSKDIYLIIKNEEMAAVAETKINTLTE